VVAWWREKAVPLLADTAAAAAAHDARVRREAILEAADKATRVGIELAAVCASPAALMANVDAAVRALADAPMERGSDNDAASGDGRRSPERMEQATSDAAPEDRGVGRGRPQTAPAAPALPNGVDDVRFGAQSQAATLPPSTAAAAPLSCVMCGMLAHPLVTLTDEPGGPWCWTCAGIVAKRTVMRAAPTRAADSPHSDADGHCSRCGLKWPDERETLEPHECPPGFTAPPIPPSEPRVSDERLQHIENYVFRPEGPHAADRRRMADNHVLDLIADLRDARAALAARSGVIEAARAQLREHLSLSGRTIIGGKCTCQTCAAVRALDAARADRKEQRT
jgi:hypothetical protein